MTSPKSFRSWRFVSAFTGGLIAVLMTLVFVAPANANIIYNPGDNRKQSPNPTTFPFSAVVEITLGKDDNGVNMGACTGWMYAPNMVATAGHCVYTSPSKVAGGYINVANMRVWPGINGSVTTTPFPSCGVVKSYAPPEYVNTYASYTDGDARFDYAALRLDCTVGNQTGVLKYGNLPPVGYTTRLVGYPSDKPYDTQWYSDDIVGKYDTYLAYYANDAVKRESGGPVMKWTGSEYNVVAIHSRGYDANYNIGPRFTNTVLNDLYNWRYYG